MKKLHNILFTALISGLLMFSACDPNKELYDEMDAARAPYSQNLEYTLVEADYNRFGGVISQYNAFNDTIAAMDYIPRVLGSRYVTLRESSSAMVTYNHFLIHPTWWDAGFGYQLTLKDYSSMGLNDAFTPNRTPQVNLPTFLQKEYPNAEVDDEKVLIYDYLADGERITNISSYIFNGSDWDLAETREDIPYVGYKLTEEDYQEFGGNIARFQNFSETYSPEKYLPVFLQHRFPLKGEGDEQVVKYNYHNGSMVVQIVDKYVFDGIVWTKTDYIEERSEQYVFGDLGWAFDPTVNFVMGRDDYMYLATIDPIPHETFNDFGYYYGATAFFSNFDIRLAARRLNRDAEGNYRDPQLGAIYEQGGSEAAHDEMMRRILDEGIIKLLQHKYPDASPQVGGIDVHFIVRFETFGDNFVRSNPMVEYICTSAGDPPQFEIYTDPRDN